MTCRRRFATTLTLFVLLLVLGTPARAQEPTTPAPQSTPTSQPTPAPQTFKVRLLAYPAKGKPTAELKKEDVHVYVDGAERPVTYFARKKAVEQIAKDLHSEYVAGYEAPAPDGKTHKVEVKAFGADGAETLKVVLRPEPEPQAEEKSKKKKKD
ncbi:MAG TPA: hypothetical protein VKB12_08785 [Pyrinomonadaceae bacterium]|nr:hypothetical protein [Pyrinomonadaceae bacterium]